MKPNSIASADENTEEISNEDNSLDNENEDFDDGDDIENEDYENNNDFKQTHIKKQQQNQEKQLNATVEENDGTGFSVRKRNKLSKKRKCRTTFTKTQLNTLECEFIKNNFVSNERLESIVKITGLDSRIIKNWFKNKRSRVMADSKSNSNQTKASPNPAPSPRQLVNNTNKLETITNLPNETKPILSDYNNNQIINSNNTNQPVQAQIPIQSVNQPDTSSISSMQTYPSRYLQPISNSNILHHQYQQQLQNSLHVDALNGSINNIAYSSDMYTNGYSNTYQNMSNTINNSYRNNNYYKMSNSDYSVNLNVSINEPVQPTYAELNNNNNINKQNNLNGLLNVVQSVSYNSIQNMQSIAFNYDSKKQVLPAPPQPPTQLIQVPYTPSFVENKNAITKINNFKSQNNQIFEAYLNSICRNCFNSPKIFCKCNVSKIALKKLYKNYTSFNSNDANLEPHKHHHQHNQTDFQATLSVSSNLSQLKRSPQIDSNKKFFEKSKSDSLVNSNNYVVNNERFVHYESVDSNTEKIFEVL